MSSKYSEYLNLYLDLQIWKSTSTWLKYFEKCVCVYTVRVCHSKFNMEPNKIWLKW